MILGNPNMKHHPNETMVNRQKMQGISTAGDQGKKSQTSQDQVEDEATQSLIKVNLVEL